LVPSQPRVTPELIPRSMHGAPAHRREGVEGVVRVAVERLAEQPRDAFRQVAVLETFPAALDLRQRGRQLDALVADGAHGGAYEARLVTGGATEGEADVPRLRVTDNFERRR